MRRKKVLDLIKANLPESVKSALRKSANWLIPKPDSSRMSNVDYNRALWDGYAKRWQKGRVTVENTSVKEAERESYLQCLGDEWGRLEDVDRVVTEYIVPY